MKTLADATVFSHRKWPCFGASLVQSGVDACLPCFVQASNRQLSMFAHRMDLDCEAASFVLALKVFCTSPLPCSKVIAICSFRLLPGQIEHVRQRHEA